MKEKERKQKKLQYFFKQQEVVLVLKIIQNGHSFLFLCWKWYNYKCMNPAKESLLWGTMGTKGCVSNMDSFLYTDVTWVLASPSLSTPQHSFNPNAKCTSKSRSITGNF